MTRVELYRNESGASAAEFAMVLPLLIMLLLGTIDAGRFAWEFNKAEKATQVGARVAVATAAIPTGLVAENYVGKTVDGETLTQGDRIRASALGLVTCQIESGALSCSCTTTPCPATLSPFENSGFDLIVQRMQFMKPDVAETNVRVEYRGSGLGFAGDPNGMDIAPLVTVSLVRLQFDPLVLFGFVNFPMPDFRTTLTAEDLSGSQSN